MPISNQEIKQIRALSARKFRDETSLFVVEGEKLVAEALSSGFEVLRVWRRDEIGEAAMARISAMSSPSPVLAVVRQRPPVAADLADGLCLALDGIRDPGNLGTILRLADWFGVSRVYASPDTVELYNPKVVQATMGAIFRCSVCYCDIPDLCRRFRAAGRRVWGTFLDGQDIYRQNLDAAGLVVMGSEADGIRPETAAQVDGRLLIPCFARGESSESLNVAVATAITLSEFRRR